MPADVPLTGVNTRPGEKPPVMPAVALVNTSEGVRQFAEFYIKTWDWGFATMSGAYMRHYIYPSCHICLSDAQTIDRSARLGHKYAGGRIDILSSKLAPEPYGRADATVLVTFNVRALHEFNRVGKRIYTNRAYRNATFQVSVVWAADRWAVYDLGAKE